MSEDRIRRQIAQRLSLRTPQEQSLNILADIVGRIGLAQGGDPVAALDAIQAAYPSVQDFERDFPSVCFAIATGVGKTRLMGAFIAWLYLAGRSKNFFVLAPNTTIYDKLVADFSKQTSPKYVFRGIAQFAQTPPVIVTGDTWEEGRGVRGSDLFGGEAIVNIFNVDKINKDKGRIRTMRETIGESYFDYLAALPDLVLLMDEAHRYRASAGMRAVNELKPALGLELTATPKSIGAKSTAFRNVVFEYGLGNAMADGMVKEPAVATRADFNRADFDDHQLELIMLEDGIHYHEHVKVELDLYARQSGRNRVHPFVLVVAQDTTHASALRARIESDEFFKGAYKGRVAEVHSNLRGDESDEAIQRLVGLETDNLTEIVIHVNKLKEGWDVNNLYTIIPLRASASDILTEQTLGRGLRLPYGERTGIESVDTLTVIAHDRFDEVIKRARDADSLVQIKALTIGKGGDVPAEAERVIDIPVSFETALIGNGSSLDGMHEEAAVFGHVDDRKVVESALDFITRKYERQLKGGVQDLLKSEVRKELAADVRRALQPAQGSLEGIVAQLRVEEIVDIVTASVAENTIDIPEIVVIPSREVNFWFDAFDLTGLQTIRYQPLSDRILIRNLRDQNQRELARSIAGPKEGLLENYIVKHLIDYDQVDYDSQSDLLYKLAAQAVSHLRSYLLTEDDVENVALAHGKAIAEFIFAQMKGHYRETPADYQAKLVRSFRSLKPLSISITSIAKMLDINSAAKPLSNTRSYVFKGTRKSPYNFHKFQSDTERRFAALIDNEFEKDVLRWVKPGPGQFQIEYRSGKAYEPDFVVELSAQKLIVEIKADGEMSDQTVQEKSRAACEWVKHANQISTDTASKAWGYAIVPESAVIESATLAGLMAKHRLV
ncbi:DEAD/DEAH box helicase family protein [Mesorhizobium sp. YC-39]|uniref:DEAD/DEAH box helicase n=1 Tax=unclassified Mesorhizobium TaxID=325217 RepID=UPI0021E84C63|nr:MULTISPECIES: DEAD/DEAH box helicase family protein [unclassified Mesorhizobium]MCV3205575.1 DEAD/DEAH box helicase family protein [Mesorhizobium sp. YC-2]MCV3228026.1 DEAD/DEAH box helicase family protein [Mesorhizobium sp. YC-39]